MSTPTYTPSQQVRVSHEGQIMADAIVVEWTDDSDTQIGNVEELLTLDIVASHNAGWPLCRLRLRRPHWARGHQNWERRRKSRTLYRQIAVEPAP